MSVTVEQLETLAVYVPPAVALMAFRQPNRQPGGTSRRFYAATAFADISGFTPLAESLAVDGVRGAEELTAILNQVFESLITTVESHGGQVVKFGGDALSVIWPCNPPDSQLATGISLTEAVWRAAQAAFAMQGTMTNFSTVSTRQGDFDLRMKIGLSVGELLEVHAGGVFNRWEYVLAGQPMVQMSSAENLAEAGEIVVDEQVWQLLLKQEQIFRNTHAKVRYLSGDEVAPGFYDLNLLWDRLMPEALPHPTWPDLEVASRSKAAAILRCYIPGAIATVLEYGNRDMLAELKPMTVCFVGFSGIDYDHDAEAGVKLSNFMRDAQEMIYHYEGSVNKLAVGDKGSVLLVLFGAPPFFHEDDEVRAVACALALLQVGHRHKLEVQVGLAAGPLFAGPIGAPQRREYSVIGDTVNLTARLMQKAHASQVYVDLSVESKTRRFFEYQDLGLLPIKGKTEARHAYLVLGDKEQDREELVMGYLLSTQELTGRDNEVVKFDQLADKVWSGHGQVLLLSGEAGVGKSRLAAEFVRRWMMRGGVSHGGDCVSYGRQTPYLPWRGIISSLAGLSPRLTAEQRLNRLEGILHRLPEQSGKDGDYWLERLPLVAEILGLKAEETELIRSLPDNLRRDNVFATIRAMIFNEAKHRSMMILLEDTHWSDELSLDLASHLAAEIYEHPILLILAHRPLPAPVPLVYQRLQALPHASPMMVSELDPQASLKLVQNKLGVKTLPVPLADLICRKGQGNPFFIEELVNSLLEMNTLKVEDGCCLLTNDLTKIEMPDTVQKVVLARIDRLPEAEKITLKVAAVIGRTFQRDLLEAVHPLLMSNEALNEQLARLQADDFTRQEVKEDDLDFLFKHVITQEVAYETMLYSQRRQLHATVGAVLENNYTTNNNEVIDLLAHHYSRSDNRAKALEYLARAGQKALDGYANEAAISYFNEALTVAEELKNEAVQFDLLAGREQAYNRLGNRDAQTQDLALMKKLAVAANNMEQQLETSHRRLQLITNLGRYDRAIANAEQAMELARQAKNLHWEAKILLNWGIIYWRQGNYESARQVMQQILELNGLTDNRQLQATCLNYLGLIHTQIANYGQAREDYQKALTLYRQIGDRGGEAGCANNLGLLESSLGRYEEARQSYAQALAICQAIGDRLREGISLNTLGQVQTILGNYESAKEHLQRSLEIRHAIGDRRGEAFGLHDLGYLYMGQGQAQEAVAQFNAAVQLRQELGETGNYVASLAAKGASSFMAGDLETATACLTEATNKLGQGSGSGEYPPQNVWWAYFQLCQAQGQEAESIHALENAYQLVKAKAERISDPQMRISYLQSVSVNAAIVESMVEYKLKAM